MTKTMFILYRIAYAPARKSYRIWLLFTLSHKNGCGGAISVTERSCAAAICKVEWRHISDRCSHYTGEAKWLEWVMKSATHHSKNNQKKKNNNNNIHMNLDLSYYQKLVSSKTGYAGNKICPLRPYFTKASSTCFSLTQASSWEVLLK